MFKRDIVVTIIFGCLTIPHPHTPPHAGVGAWGGPPCLGWGGVEGWGMVRYPKMIVTFVFILKVVVDPLIPCHILADIIILVMDIIKLVGGNVDVYRQI